VPTESELKSQLAALGNVLTQRSRKSRILDAYTEDCAPMPAAITRSKLTNAYKLLMPMATAPWGSVVVESVLDRLEAAGVNDVQDKAAGEACWGLWQDNQMDSEWKLVLESALTKGRAFGLAWPGDTAEVEFSFDGPEQMVVQYRPGSRRHREAALRYWIDGDRPYATLYRREALYKFIGPKNSGGFDGTQWERREVPDEEWPLPNTLGEIPVVEFAVNRKLKPGTFPYARGEFEHVTGLLDRINLLTFLGLVVAFWQGFPLRGVIGDTILRDDDNKVLPPFKVGADEIFQLENPAAKLAEFKAADRGNLSIFGELAQLAYLTKTPAHYFPMETGMSNISGDTVMALEGGLHAKLANHKGSLGEPAEELLRVGGRMLKKPVRLSPRAELQWKDSESRSLAERADAATKLKDILPGVAIAELALNVTQDQWNRWQAMNASNALGQLMAQAAAGGK
jgi:hypothetical protein